MTVLEEDYSSTIGTSSKRLRLVCHYVPMSTATFLPCSLIPRLFQQHGK